jgi:hypothetical protein
VQLKVRTVCTGGCAAIGAHSPLAFQGMLPVLPLAHMVKGLPTVVTPK